MNALKQDAYTPFVLYATVATIVLALSCGCAITLLFIRPFQPSPQWSRFTLVSATVSLLALVFFLWTILVTVHHRDAVEDFMDQLTNSTDVFLDAALKDSLKMVKQAYQIWEFTGAETSALAPTTVWSAEMLQDFYDSSRLSTLRFATTAGLERSANATVEGVRVLNREFYGSGATRRECMVTYMADGTTHDSVNYPDDCHYDPRYTKWYDSGRGIFAGGSKNAQVTIL